MSTASLSIRPGGIKAISIMSFIVGGLQVFGSLIWFSCLSIVTADGTTYGPGELVNSIASLVSGVLYLISASGLVKLHKISGRVIGIVAALIALLGIVLRFVLPSTVGYQISLGDISTMLFPLCNIVFLSFVFADLWSASGKKGSLQGGDKVLSAWHLISSFSFKQRMRSAATFLTYTLGAFVVLSVANLIYVPLEWIAKSEFGAMIAAQGTQGQGNTLFLQFIQGTIAELLGVTTPDNNFARFILLDRPGFASLSFLVFSSLLPFLTMLIGASAISSDNQNKGLRFVLLRTSRRDIFNGKLAAVALINTMLTLLVFVLTFVFTALKYPEVYQVGELLLWTLRGFVAMVLASLPFCVLAVALSAVINSVAGSLLTGLGILLVPGITLLASSALKEIRVIEFLLPQKAAFYLLHPEPAYVLVALASVAAYSLVFYFGGLKIFERRNL